MKGLVTLGVFAFFYILIIILFNVVAGEPRGVQDKNIGQPDSGAHPLKEDNDKNGAKNGTSEPSAPGANFGSVATDHFPSQNGGKTSGVSSDASLKPAQRAAGSSPMNDSNPLADLFQIGDPTMRTALGAVYGAYRGSDQCSRKAFCMMGNYMKDMPGRDLVFMFMGNYIPAEYSLYYEIFKVAVMYGQNCDVYVCIPDAAPPDAASAARPSTTTTRPPQRMPQQQQQQQQQQNSNRLPQQNKPPSLQDAFDNTIPR